MNYQTRPDPKPLPHYVRRSPDSVWPLRCADGRTFAERQEGEKQ